MQIQKVNILFSFEKMGAKSKKERGVSVSNTNYGGSTSEAGTSRNTNAGSNGKDERLEQLQADHELFLQAFESMW